MTAQELIDRLSALPDRSVRVVVRGYEGGVDGVTEIVPVTIALNVHSEWYYGRHEIQDRHTRHHHAEKVAAIVLVGGDAEAEDAA